MTNVVVTISVHRPSASSRPEGASASTTEGGFRCGTPLSLAAGDGTIGAAAVNDRRLVGNGTSAQGSRVTR
jgi:hypothetical protein